MKLNVGNHNEKSFFQSIFRVYFEAINFRKFGKACQKCHWLLSIVSLSGTGLVGTWILFLERCYLVEKLVHKGLKVKSNLSKKNIDNTY